MPKVTKEADQPRKNSFDKHFMEDVFKDQFFEGTKDWAFGEEKKQSDVPNWDTDPWAGGDAVFTNKQTN